MVTSQIEGGIEELVTEVEGPLHEVPLEEAIEDEYSKYDINSVHDDAQAIAQNYLDNILDGGEKKLYGGAIKTVERKANNLAKLAEMYDMMGSSKSLEEQIESDMENESLLKEFAQELDGLDSTNTVKKYLEELKEYSRGTGLESKVRASSKSTGDVIGKLEEYTTKIGDAAKEIKQRTSNSLARAAAFGGIVLGGLGLNTPDLGKPARESVDDMPPTTSELVLEPQMDMYRQAEEAYEVILQPLSQTQESNLISDFKGKWGTIIEEYAKRVSEEKGTFVDPNIIGGLILKETADLEDDISPTAAAGLGQIVNGTARNNLGWDTYFDNRRPRASELEDLKEQYKGDPFGLFTEDIRFEKFTNLFGSMNIYADNKISTGSAWRALFHYAVGFPDNPATERNENPYFDPAQGESYANSVLRLARMYETAEPSEPGHPMLKDPKAVPVLERYVANKLEERQNSPEYTLSFAQGPHPALKSE